MPAPVHGAARLSFIRDGPASRLDRLEQRAPLRVLFPSPHDPGVPLAVLVTTSGGLVGGDRLDTAVATAEGARALVTTQAAEKIYRSEGATCEIDVVLEAGQGSWLEWLPNETIVFDGARLRRRIVASLSADATLLAGEILVLGRRARGERFSAGLVQDAWKIRRNGRLIWTDAFRLEKDIREAQASSAGLAGAAAIATIICVGDMATRLATPFADLADSLAAPDLRIGTTRIGGTLLARLLAQDARALRQAVSVLWGWLRHEAGGLSPRLQRLWSI